MQRAGGGGNYVHPPFIKCGSSCVVRRAAPVSDQACSETEGRILAARAKAVKKEHARALARALQRGCKKAKERPENSAE